MGTGSGVAVSGVTHEYGTGSRATVALTDLDLTVAPGEFVALMGVSGSGKSTLISILGGLLVPTSGEVESFGFDLATCPSTERARYRREIATVVFQEYNLFSMLTAHENVATALEFWGVERSSAAQRAEEVLGEVGLTGLGNRYPGQLSGGQRQRVAIARALASPRKLVLADEPTAAIDRGTGAMVKSMFRRLVERGAAVVVATHDPQFAAGADRVVELTDGQVTTAIPA